MLYICVHYLKKSLNKKNEFERAIYIFQSLGIKLPSMVNVPLNQT